MKLYKITIKPTSTFATKLKGDTLFGQLCWAIKYSFGEPKLTELLKSYRSKPFLIVSDAFLSAYLPKPKMPSRYLAEDETEKKQNRKKVWLKLDDLLNAKYYNAKTDKELKNKYNKKIDIHNSINYKTFHTSEGFDPYGIEVENLLKQDIYFLLDEEQLSLNDFKKAFSLFCELGYGKKATIGKGRFEYDDNGFENITVNNHAKAYMGLSPFTPNDLDCKNIYYDPFTRFGKFGGDRVYKNPFKKPILLADTATVIEFENPQEYQYIGRAITDITDVTEYKDTVHQGYSIVLPLKDLK